MSTLAAGPVLMLRRATPDDNAAIAASWNDAVRSSEATTETELRTLATQAEWLAAHDETHPVIVAVDGSDIVAWGSLSPYRPRPAFVESVEDSVYVKAGRQRRGVGARVLEELIRLAHACGHHTIIARIRSTNTASLTLHARFGFAIAGVEREVARVAGRRVDVVVMQLLLPS